MKRISLVLAFFIILSGCNQDGACWTPGSQGPGQGGSGPVQLPSGGFGDDPGNPGNDGDPGSGDTLSNGCPKTGPDPKPSGIVNYLCTGVVKNCSSVADPEHHSGGLCYSARGVGPTEYQAQLSATEDCEADLDHDHPDGAPWVCLSAADTVCAPQYDFNATYKFPCYDAGTPGVSQVCESTGAVITSPSCDDARYQEVASCVEYFRLISKWKSPACPQSVAGVQWSCSKKGSN